MARLRRVALLIETSRAYGRGVLQGVRRRLSEEAGWSVYLETRDLEAAAPPWLRRWSGDGILARTGGPALARQIRAAALPTIELRSRRWNPRIPWIGVDNRALGAAVAEHLLDRGFRSFGLLALDTEDFFRERCANFTATLRARGFSCERRDGGSRAPWEAQQRDLVRWLRRLPKPAGVMACTDQLGFWLLDAAVRAGISCPEELAVVGVENDDALCAMARPPMSSVALPTERVGYEAARLLERLMRGRDVPRVTLLPPLGVVTRQSSDVVALQDPRLAASLRFMRERPEEGVEAAVRAGALSRSSLERGLRAQLGRSPHEELRRVRLERARRLLLETDLKLRVVAARSGFKHAQLLCAAFQARYGCTPGRFRASPQ